MRMKSEQLGYNYILWNEACNIRVPLVNVRSDSKCKDKSKSGLESNQL